MATIRAIRGDITSLAVGAIVNAANRSLQPGSGVDGAIRAAGGPEITAETEAVGGIETGNAVATTAGRLQAEWVIHTAGPIWGSVTEADADSQLSSCYRSSLELAGELGVESIAFPNISTGVYRFPPERAARLAVAAVRQWNETKPDAPERVLFVCLDEASYLIYRDLLGL